MPNDPIRIRVNHGARHRLLDHDKVISEQEGRILAAVMGCRSGLDSEAAAVRLGEAQR